MVNNRFLHQTVLLVLSFLMGSSGFAIEIKNFGDLASEAGFYEEYSVPHQRERTLRIAIMDNGFAGWEDALGDSLPVVPRHFPPSVGKPGTSKHGLAMAVILQAFLTDQGEYMGNSPHLYLFETSAFSDFQKAVSLAIKSGVDIILNSRVLEYGGNFDGRGYYNQEVNRALRAGIIWVNAAGNFGDSVFNINDIETEDGDWVKLPGRHNSIAVRCKPLPNRETCPARFVLSWNEFKEFTGDGTNKDLDLFLMNEETLDVVGGSQLKQVEADADLNRGESLYPREIVEQDLQPGVYLLRVKNRSKNFQARSRARISGQGDGLTFEFSDNRENLNVPADNPGVITVGEATERSSFSRSLGKPELIGPSIIQTGEDRFAGTSNAAAIAAAAVGLSLLQGTDKTKAALVDALTTGKSMLQVGRGIPSRALGFRPANERCYQVLRPTREFPSGVIVRLNDDRKAIMLPYDPARFLPRGGRPPGRYDKIVSSPRGGVYALPQQDPLRRDEIQLFEFPSDEKLCEPINFRGWPRPVAGPAGFRFKRN